MNARTELVEMSASLPTEHRAAATPADLVRYAMETNADLDRLEKLMQLQIVWEEREARKAFVSDMAEFKRNAPTIVKDHQVNFKTDKGVTSYWHATIGNVVEKIVAGLAEHGFSHRWIPTRGEGGMIKITCVITHKLGHSEETVLEAGLDQTGGKNNIQAMISTKTYLERHSLLAATGLATKDMSDDFDEKEAERRYAAAQAEGAAVTTTAARTPPQRKAEAAPGDAPAQRTAPTNQQPVSKGQIANIRNKAKSLNLDEAGLCQQFGVAGGTFDGVTQEAWTAIKNHLAGL